MSTQSTENTTLINTQAFICITSLSEPSHKEDNFDDILPFCEKSPWKDSLLYQFCKKNELPIQLKYSENLEEKGGRFICKINGNSLMDGINNPGFKDQLEEIKLGANSVDNKKLSLAFFNELTDTIAQTITEEKPKTGDSTTQESILFTIFIHWGVDSEIVQTNMRKIIEREKFKEWSELDFQRVFGSTEKYDGDLLAIDLNEKKNAPLRLCHFHNYTTHADKGQYFNLWKKLQSCKQLEEFQKEFNLYNFDQYNFESKELEIWNKYNADDTIINDVVSAQYNDIIKYKSKHIYEVPDRYTMPNPYKKSLDQEVRIKFVSLWDKELTQVFSNNLDSHHQLLKNRIISDPDYADISFDDNTPTLIIAFAKMKDFNDSEIFRSIFFDMEHFCCPVITIGAMDLMQYYTEDISDNDDNHKVLGREVFLKLQLDKRFRFMDSSIWFRYIGLTNDFKPKLKSAIQEIKELVKDNVYNALEAREYLDLKLRILKNSYTTRLNGNDYSSFITPFISHPESRKMEKANELEKELKGFDFKYNFLLLDDQSKSNLETLNGNDKVSKYDILKTILDRDQMDYTITPYSSFNDEDLSIENLNENNPLCGYNIVFLNYEFQKDSKKKGRSTIEESAYGFEWIAELESKFAMADQTEENILRGPFRKMHIIPICSIPMAMENKLKDIGIPMQSRYFSFTPGVDPICNPQLFRWMVYSTLKIQLSEVINFNQNSVKQENDKNDTTNQNEVDDAHQSKILRILTNIANEDPMEGKATDEFSSFVRLGAFFENLSLINRHTKGDNSFVDKIIKTQFANFDLNTWSHLQNLIYMLGKSSQNYRKEVENEINYLVRFMNKSSEENSQELIDNIIVQLKKIKTKILNI